MPACRELQGGRTAFILCLLVFISCFMTVFTVGLAKKWEPPDGIRTGSGAVTSVWAQRQRAVGMLLVQLCLGTRHWHLEFWFSPGELMAKRYLKKFHVLLGKE